MCVFSPFVCPLGAAAGLVVCGIGSLDGEGMYFLSCVIGAFAYEIAVSLLCFFTCFACFWGMFLQGSRMQ